MEAKAAAQAIPGWLTAARDEEIAVAYERLANHYPHLRRSRHEAERAIEDWLDDLADIPADLIREACRLWRNSEAERFPTPGQLKALVVPMLDHRKALARRAALFLEVL